LAEGKLVRDRIPEIIRARGEEPIVHAISGEALLDALIAKLAEESEELRSAAIADQAEELADLLEVVRAIALHLGIDLQELEEVGASKREERGGFAEGLWLEMPSPT
jgi:predicted house-cleaning noncanonical NTP pyrophosphatase (MazG superfamily)